jgi:hypothetical protein
VPHLDANGNSPRNAFARMVKPSTSLQTKFFERNGALFVEQHNGEPVKGHCLHRKAQPGDRQTFAKEYAEYKAAGGKL